MAELSALKTDSERISYIYLLLQREYQTGGSASWTAAYGRKKQVSATSLAAAADWMFSEAGIPAFLARSWSAAWNVVYVPYYISFGYVVRNHIDHRLGDVGIGFFDICLHIRRTGRRDPRGYRVCAVLP